jgi:phosphoribosyl-ATP pyrophosphohydrolase
MSQAGNALTKALDFFLPHKGGDPVPVPDLDDTAEFTPYPPGPLTISQLQERIAAWRKRAIPNATVDGQIDKLEDEADELSESCWLDGIEGVLKEAADVCIVACNVADLAGLSFADILLEKQARNEAKTWKEDGSGKAQHVKEDD